MSVETFIARWVPLAVAERKALRVALDWTEFEKSDRKERQGEYEDAVIELLPTVEPAPAQSSDNC